MILKDIKNAQSLDELEKIVSNSEYEELYTGIINLSDDFEQVRRELILAIRSVSRTNFSILKEKLALVTKDFSLLKQRVIKLENIHKNEDNQLTNDDYWKVELEFLKGKESAKDIDYTYNLTNRPHRRYTLTELYENLTGMSAPNIKNKELTEIIYKLINQ